MMLDLFLHKAEWRGGLLVTVIEIKNNHIKKKKKVVLCWSQVYTVLGFPGGSDSKESAFSAGDLGLISGLGISPREGNSNPLQYSCLVNFMARGDWWATVHGVTKNQT